MCIHILCLLELIISDILKSVFFFRVIWAMVFFSSAETFIPLGSKLTFFFSLFLCINPKMKRKSMWIGHGSTIFLLGHWIKSLRKLKENMLLGTLSVFFCFAGICQTIVWSAGLLDPLLLNFLILYKIYVDMYMYILGRSHKNIPFPESTSVRVLADSAPISRPLNIDGQYKFCTSLLPDCGL